MYGDGGSSDGIARDMKSCPLHSSTFKHPPKDEFKELISWDSYSNNNHHEQNHNYSCNENQNRNWNHNQQLGGQTESSLVRYRSAPSSFYSSLVDDFLEERFLSSDEIFQSSSPAGFLSSLNAETGLAAINDMEKTISSSRTNNRISFSTMPSSSPPFLPSTIESKNEINDYTSRSLKRTRNGDSKMFPSSIILDIENGSSPHYAPSLVHHMSLPKTYSEMATAEKLLRFEQDSVPCKIRAKRGCATHPRSIAERVRRTRISERMKKIQALFPNMDKQTSTADMLELAVQYIKDLQKELQTLNDAQSRCTCSSEQ